MQIENLTAPMPQSPQMRYATLHRALESGIDTEGTWADMVKVCLELELHDEAVRAYQNVQTPSERLHLQNLLVRHGALTAGEAKKRLAEDRARHVEIATNWKDEVTAAGHLLFQDHMPLTVIAFTLTFPVVVGLGGVLTHSIPSLLLQIVALLPGLLVLGLAGAYGHRILTESRRGLEDTPAIPPMVTFVREGAQAALELLVFLPIFLGPAALLLHFGAHVGSVLAAILAGCLALPMAFLMRNARRDWRAIQPQHLLPMLFRGGLPYALAALTISALFVPALLAGFATLGSKAYLVISVVGPLAIAPLFVAARLLGRMAHLHRDRLNLDPTDVVAAPAQPVMTVKQALARSKAASGPRPRVNGQARGTQPAPQARPRTPQPAPQAPEARERVPADESQPQRVRVAKAQFDTRPVPNKRPLPTPVGARQTEAARPAPAGNPAKPKADAAPTASRPASAGRAKAAAGASKARAKALDTTPAPLGLRLRDPAPQPEPAAKVVDELPPELRSLPGIKVVSGDARDHTPAAAKNRRPLH